MKTLVTIIECVMLFGSLGGAVALSYIGHHDRWVLGLTIFWAGYQYYLCARTPE
jgi:hypothetical protein